MNYFIFDLDDTLYQNVILETNNKYTNKSLEVIKLENIKQLVKIGKLILFSNANNSHCQKWLQDLGIKEYFSFIVSYDTFNIYKPNPIVYQKVNNCCGITDKDTVFFFDDLPINLLSAYKNKWNTILIKKNYIKNKNDIYIHNIFDNINLAINFILMFLK